MSNYRHITPGGCGSHWLGRFMRESCGMRFPSGWNGHARDPNKNAAPENKIIYLMADPYDTMMSFQRRGFFHNSAHCQQMSGNMKLMQQIKEKGGLPFLIKQGQDPYEFEAHLKGWMEYDERKYDLLVVKYEHLLELIPDVLTFFNAYTPERVERFRKSYVPRQGNWDEAPDDTKRGLEAIYGEYREWWLTLDTKMLFPRSG